MNEDKENSLPRDHPIIRCACGGVACILLQSMSVESRLCHACFNRSAQIMVESGIRFRASTIS
jgi:hypothetical protein